MLVGVEEAFFVKFADQRRYGVAMISGGSALPGLLRGRPTSKSLIVTERGGN
jgi:hypothetical protein